MSIFEMVERIGKFYGYSTDNLNRISTDTLNQKAVRPPRTGFILEKAINNLGYSPHSFEQCLAIIKTNTMRKIILICFCFSNIYIWSANLLPDDNFEAWIETTYPAADNGAANDN